MHISLLSLDALSNTRESIHITCHAMGLFIINTSCKNSQIMEWWSGITGGNPCVVSSVVISLVLDGLSVLDESSFFRMRLFPPPTISTSLWSSCLSLVNSPELLPSPIASLPKYCLESLPTVVQGVIINRSSLVGNVQEMYPITIPKGQQNVATRRCRYSRWRS